MLQPKDGLPRFLARFQLKFMHACAVALLISLILYTVSMTDVRVKTAESIQSWNISLHLQNVVSTIRSAIKPQNIPRKRKLVLLWTDYFSQKDWLPTTVNLDCPVKECDTTTDRSLLLYSSAVILHWRNIDLNNLPNCDSSIYVNCPLWLLFNKEAPPHTPKDILEAIQNKVHWTVTYRKDSDIIAPYGKLLLKQTRSSLNTDFDPNRRLLCWLVSNCQTPGKRELFVKKLQEHVEVDIYGACGNLTCPYQPINDCYQWMSKRCLFYLSLENSNCKDYVTEKLYYALAANMVPVVMGNNSNYKHLPPRSYVNTADFSSPKELAEYLVNVGSNKEKYLSYFWWKSTQEAKDQSYRWFCDLCEKLHTTEIDKVKPHSDLISWWYGDSECTS